MWPDHREKLLKHVLIVLAVPNQTQFTVRVFEFSKLLLDGGFPGRLWSTISGTPEVAQSIDQDRFEPRTKSTCPAIVIELFKIFRYCHQHFLKKVVRVTCSHLVIPKP